jgi:hypothetical protein
MAGPRGRGRLPRRRASRSGSTRGCRLESGDSSRHGLTLRNRRSAVLAGLLEAVRAGQRGTLVVRRALVSSRSDARDGLVHRSGRPMRTRSARLVRPQVARGDGPLERDRVGARPRGARSRPPALRRMAAPRAPTHRRVRTAAHRPRDVRRVRREGVFTKLNIRSRSALDQALTTESGPAPAALRPISPTAMAA